MSRVSEAESVWPEKQPTTKFSRPTVVVDWEAATVRWRGVRYLRVTLFRTFLEFRCALIAALRPRVRGDEVRQPRR